MSEITLSAEDVKNLKGALSASSAVKIDNIIIEDSKLRGIDTAKTVVVMAEDQSPDLEGKRLGISRIDDLLKRINLLDQQADFEVKAILSDNDDSIITHLSLSAGKSKTKYRTSNPDNIRAPKSFNDNQAWLIVVNADDVDSVIKSSSVISSDEVVLVKKADGTAYIHFIDSVTQDSLEVKIADSCDALLGQDESETVMEYYRAKSLLPLLKRCSDVALIVGEKGMLWVDVDGYNFTLIPRIGA